MKFIRKMFKVAIYGLAALGAFIVVLIVAAAIFKDPSPQAVQEAAETPAPVAEVAEVIEGQTKDKNIAENPSPSVLKSKTEWIARDYRIIENKDISVASRARRKVFIVAPTAVTPEDRLATLVRATSQIWRNERPSYISTFLLAYDVGVPVARVSYAPDGCGVSGQDCTEKIWTEAAASNVEFTSEQERIHTAWEANRRRFMEIDEDYKKKYNIDVENLNEARLKEFLAREFDTTIEHITSQIRKTLLVSLNDLTLPKSLTQEYELGDDDEAKFKESKCRHDLQCWGDKHNLAATFACQPLIEGMAKYDYEWTDGWLGAKLERFRWKDRKAGTLSYTGNKVKFQNGFGAWQHITYWCHYDPLSKSAEASVQ